MYDVQQNYNTGYNMSFLFYGRMGINLSDNKY